MRDELEEDQKKKLLSIMKDKFDKNIALIHHLPNKPSDSLKSLFYNKADNWFYKAFDLCGYDPSIVGKAFQEWLSGAFNTVVIVGDVLSIGKSVFNEIARCFPTAVFASEMNSMREIADVSKHSPLYCVSFVDKKPAPTMMQLMEGQSIQCIDKRGPFFINSVSMLIHCSNPEIAPSFIAQGTMVFFLYDHYSKLPSCCNPRGELADFVLNSALRMCKMNVHCKRDKPICAVCNEK